jgi:hypothetical protein
MAQLKLPLTERVFRSRSKQRYKRRYRIQRLLCSAESDIGQSIPVYELYWHAEFIGVSHDIRQLRVIARRAWQ